MTILGNSQREKSVDEDREVLVALWGRGSTALQRLITTMYEKNRTKEDEASGYIADDA